MHLYTYTYTALAPTLFQKDTLHQTPLWLLCHSRPARQRRPNAQLKHCRFWRARSGIFGIPVLVQWLCRRVKILPKSAWCMIHCIEWLGGWFLRTFTSTSAPPNDKERLFFLAYGQNWCNLDRPKSVGFNTLRDGLSPSLLSSLPSACFLSCSLARSLSRARARARARALSVALILSLSLPLSLSFR